MSDYDADYHPQGTTRERVEEDGDEVFTPIPSCCTYPSCGGSIKPINGFYACEQCGRSYGPADWCRQRAQREQQREQLVAAAPALLAALKDLVAAAVAELQKRGELAKPGRVDNA